MELADHGGRLPRASARQITAVIPYYAMPAPTQKPLAAKSITAKIGGQSAGDPSGWTCGWPWTCILPDPGLSSIFPVITSTDHRCWWIISPPVISGEVVVVSPWMSVAVAKEPGPSPKRQHDAPLADHRQTTLRFTRGREPDRDGDVVLVAKPQVLIDEL